VKQYRILTLTVTLLLVAAALLGCVQQVAPQAAPEEAPAQEEQAEPAAAPEEAEPEATVEEAAAEEEEAAEEEPAAEEMAESGEPLQLGLVTHFTSPFTEQIADGARSAAEDYGAELEVVGPVGFDGQEEISMFEALVQKGLDGIAVIPNPPEIWAEPIRRAQEAGVAVVTLNVLAVDTPAPTWFGQDEFGSGVILAEEMLTHLLVDEGGKIVVGECVPGVPVLMDRFDGFMEVMAEYPQFEVVGPFDVGVDPTANYGAWQNLLSANPDTIAMVGLCAPDMPNLTRLRDKTGAEFVAVGYDLEPDALTGIQAGLGEVTVGQNPYLQGYLPIKALAEHLQEGTPLPEGWVDVGTEVVDAENVEEVMAREGSLEVTQEFYQEIIDEQYQDLNAIVKPLP
jgi:ABC-type sugar transport system substrate-binding protein